MGGGMSGGMGWREGGGGLGEGMSVSAAFGREMLEAMTAWGRAGGEAGGEEAGGGGAGGGEAGGGGTPRGPNEPQSPCCWGAAATPSASTLGAGPPRVEGGDPRHNLNQRRVRWGPAAQGKQPFHTPAAPAAEPAAAAAASAAAMPLPLRQKSEARPPPAAAAPATAAIPPPPRSLLLLLASTSELRQAARNALGSGCLAELARASTRASPLDTRRQPNPPFTRVLARALTLAYTRRHTHRPHTPPTHTAHACRRHPPPSRRASTSAHCAPARRCWSSCRLTSYRVSSCCLTSSSSPTTPPHSSYGTPTTTTFAAASPRAACCLSRPVPSCCLAGAPSWQTWPSPTSSLRS